MLVGILVLLLLGVGLAALVDRAERASFPRLAAGNAVDPRAALQRALQRLAGHAVLESQAGGPAIYLSPADVAVVRALAQRRGSYELAVVLAAGTEALPVTRLVVADHEFNNQRNLRLPASALTAALALPGQARLVFTLTAGASVQQAEAPVRLP